jgi:hypothetical protein
MRRSELEKLTSGQIKKAIKEKSIDAEQLSSKATKLEMIEHIQSAIAFGWPNTRSVIDESRY